MDNEIKDGDGHILHEGDRVYAHEFDGKMVYGTLAKSEHPLTLGRWCVDYDDGESYIVLDFGKIYKA